MKEHIFLRAIKGQKTPQPELKHFKLSQQKHENRSDIKTNQQIFNLAYYGETHRTCQMTLKF